MHHCSRIEPAALMHQLGGQWHSLNRVVLSRFAEHADDYSNKTEGHSPGRRSERFCRRLGKTTPIIGHSPQLH